MSDAVIRFDHYAARHWAALTDREQSDIRAAVPDGQYLSLTHGGRTYSASLHLMDGEEVDRHTAFSLRYAIELLLTCQFETTITLDGTGYVKDIEP